MGAGQRVPPVRSATGRPQPNQALEPTPYSVRCAPAFRRGSLLALAARGNGHLTQEDSDEYRR
jgi:hypothetical protein